jgi:hypothetical protein
MFLIACFAIVGIFLLGSFGLAVLGLVWWFVKNWKAWLIIGVIILLFYH